MNSHHLFLNFSLFQAISKAMIMILKYTLATLVVLLTTIAVNVNRADAQSSAYTKQKSSPFIVKNIKIDVTAQNSKSARDKAFKRAQEESLEVLMEQLDSSGYDTAFLRQADNKVIANTIKDFEISNEKISAVRYKGDFVFRYDEEKLSQYLYGNYAGYNGTYGTYGASAGQQASNDHGFTPPFSAQNTDRVLVLPFFQANGGALTLWEGQNPWLALWSQRTNDNLMAPIGDLSDLRDISDEQALTYNPENMARLGTRYQADRVIILISNYEGAAVPQSNSAMAQGRLRVSMYDTARGRPEFVNDIVIDGGQHQNFGEVLNAAYVQSANMIAGIHPIKMVGQHANSPNVQYQSSNEGANAQGYQSTLQARLEYTSMQDWLKAQQMMRNVANVKKIDVLSLTPRVAEVKLNYVGTIDDLATAMMEKGYNIQPTTKTGRYLIYSGRAAAYNQNGGMVYR